MIEFQDVHKAYGHFEVLKGITAKIDKGEVVCIIGPSGSGKSTMLRCVNGLESYQKGRLLVEDQLVTQNPRDLSRVRDSVAMVFQRFNLFPHRTVLQNVVEGSIYVKGEARKSAEERGLALLERVGLAAKADAFPQMLSGGQQQRVAIASARDPVRRTDLGAGS